MAGAGTASETVAEQGPPRPAARGALYAVSVLTAMNLLNYLDRYVPSAVKDLFKVDPEVSLASLNHSREPYYAVKQLEWQALVDTGGPSPRRLSRMCRKSKRACRRLEPAPRPRGRFARSR